MYLRQAIITCLSANTQSFKQEKKNEQRFSSNHPLIQNTWKSTFYEKYKIIMSSQLSVQQEVLASLGVMSSLVSPHPPVTCETSVVSRTSWPHCVPAVSPPSPCEPRPATPDSPDPTPQTHATDHSVNSSNKYQRSSNRNCWNCKELMIYNLYYCDYSSVL